METDKSKRDRRVTIKDVAKAADVSIATVSYVLNNKQGQSISEDTRKKVLQFANLLGYECNVMAKYLATGKSNTVAAVIGDLPPVAAPYYMRLLTELSRKLNKHNIALAIADYADACKSGGMCDAYISIALPEKDFREFADTQYVPVIAIDSEFQDYLFYRINDDHAVIGEKAKREFGVDGVDLLTFALPEECLRIAGNHYRKVIVIDELKDIASLDKFAYYATVSKLIYDNAVGTVNITLENKSSESKACAAADAVIKAINRVQAPPHEHDIRV